MKSVLAFCFSLCLSFSAIASDQATHSKLSWKLLADLQLPINNGSESWLERGGGKFRFSERDSGEVRIATLGTTLSYKFSNTSTLLTTLLYNEDPDENIVLTEAFWHYRPVPKSQWKQEYRLGLFHGPFSLENSGPLWTSPYTLSPSVINSWFGEELRTLGVEGNWRWQSDRRSPHQFNLTAAMFAGNDTAGALLSWRGWGNTDRQTGVNEQLPLRALPNLAPGGAFDKQTPWIEPFVEVDNRPGFYLGAEWKYRRKLKLTLNYYDNQAKSSELKNGQYGWRTKFTQASLSWKLNKNTTLLGQYLEGSTVMNVNIVDNDFDSAYLLLTHRFKRHRFTARWETFSVDDLDNVPMDNNFDDGHNITFAYAYRFPKHWKLTLEGIRHQSERRSRKYFSEKPKITENRLTVSLRYYF